MKRKYYRRKSEKPRQLLKSYKKYKEEINYGKI